MKNLIIVLLNILILVSCKKEDFGQYKESEEIEYNITTNDFIYGGVLPDNDTYVNELVGTKWVLTKYVSAFATEYPNDTIHFISQNTYTLNNGAERTYQLSSIPSSTNFDLSLYFFFPFGGSHYSGNVGGMFIQDNEINGVEFHNIQNTTSTIRAWFIKI